MTPRYKPRRQAAYDYLIEHHMTPLEARMLSVLPRNTPALRAMVADRDARWDRFEKIASRKIAAGRWQPQDIDRKWTANLLRYYRKAKAIVKGQTRGRQQRMPKGAPNPWALYRRYVKANPGNKGYDSPWEKKKYGPKSPLDKAQWVVRRASNSTVSSAQLRLWISQVDRSIRYSRGDRREAFIGHRAALQKMLDQQS